MTTTLADLDEAFEAAGEFVPSPEWYAALPAPWLSNGLYTLTFPDGSHKTFRVRIEKNGTYAGKRSLALLIGPDNTKDYEPVGLVTATGFSLWRRFANGKVGEHAAKLWALAQGAALHEHSLLKSAVCRVCNRPLNDPESISTEVGPTCRARVGL
ncbi:MAG TPA: DUF6011 domain-containing protein [Gemmata sp.]